MNLTGSSILSPAANTCLSKQKHSVLWKYSAPLPGETLGITWPTISLFVGL